MDWSFAGTTEEEFATLMAIFHAEDQEVYIADYEHLGVYACRIIVRYVGHLSGRRSVAGKQQHGRASA